MFGANFVANNDKLSSYVMHKHLIIYFKIFAKEFDIDHNPLKLIGRSLYTYTKDLTINLLFTY